MLIHLIVVILNAVSCIYNNKLNIVKFFLLIKLNQLIKKFKLDWLLKAVF